MRRTKKILVLCSAVAAITAGGAMTAMAAQSGWQQENGTWCYVDSNGNKATDTWKKSGNSWYYLNSDGDMVTDQWVDDTFYTDENGAMVTNRWVYIDPGTEDAPNTEGGWFYLDGSGKAVTDGWKTINNRKYYFDSDGAMAYGWFTDNEDLYYLGDENQGWAYEGWACLDYDPDNPPEDGDVSAVENSGSDTSKWFYFQTGGKAVKASSGTYVSRTINGSKYYFDENGVMLTGWASIASGSDAAVDATGISSFKYFGGDNEGQMAKGWRYLTDYPEDSDDAGNLTQVPGNLSYDSEGSWYYFDSNGVPKYLRADADTMSKAVSRVNGQSYFFDQYGRMQYGLIGIGLRDGTVESAYFGDSGSDGKMRTDKISNVIEDNGDKSTFFFETSGSNRGGGFTGEKKKYLYYNGKLVKADKGTTTQVFEVDGQLYLVNESGQVQTSNKCYKSDGEYRYEYSNGTLYYVDADKQRQGEVTSGETLPEISYKDVFSL